MGCEGCIQKIIEKNAEGIKIFKEAQELANKTGEWIGIYTDETGSNRYCRASEQGIPFRSYITPELRNS